MGRIPKLEKFMAFSNNIDQLNTNHLQNNEGNLFLAPKKK